jgi:hypothetical protein
MVALLLLLLLLSQLLLLPVLLLLLLLLLLLQVCCARMLVHVHCPLYICSPPWCACCTPSLCSTAAAAAACFSTVDQGALYLSFSAVILWSVTLLLA